MPSTAASTQNDQPTESPAQEFGSNACPEPTYSINDGLKIYLEEVRGGPRMLRVEVEVSDGTQRYMIPEDVMEVLRLFDGRRRLYEVLDVLKRRQHPTARTLCSTERLTQFVEAFCVPSRLLISDRGVPVEGRPVSRARYVRARVPILPHGIVFPIAKGLSPLFSVWVVIPVIVASLLVHAILYGVLVPAYQISVATITAAQLAQVTALAIAAAMLHEFGHAAALARHGCSSLEIGLAWYINKPVFYTDVSEAWRLAARERAIVDVSGIYFHAICVLFLAVVFVFSENVTIIYAGITIDLAIVMSLNPLFRMDGYWLLGDLYGMWSPRRQCWCVVRRVWRTGLQGAWEPLSVREWFLLCYVGASVGAFSYLTVAIAMQVITEVIPEYPHDILMWWTSVSSMDPVSVVAVMQSTGRIAWRTMLIYVCWTTAYRAVLVLRKQMSNRHRIWIAATWDRINPTRRDGL